MQGTQCDLRQAGWYDTAADASSYRSCGTAGRVFHGKTIARPQREFLHGCHVALWMWLSALVVVTRHHNGEKVRDPCRCVNPVKVLARCAGHDSKGELLGEASHGLPNTRKQWNTLVHAIPE